ncbi:MAG TPA: sugar ABC transporter permease [Rubellimicrobium sp.]|jgi:D-xylose transport system permease protein|nr:sugar ABC transporter permease [Rubellimicrobium sp.]
MSDAAGTGSGIAPRRGFLSQLEIDLRLLGMLGAFALLCLAFGFYTGGTFLTPRNIFNIAIQTVSVGIMATGMVFVIVMRNIDLSVGSVLAMCSAVMAVVQARWLPDVLGLGHPLIAPVTILAGLLVGTAIGALHGWLAGYQEIPSFIVTLGGLLVWRNVSWYTTGGQTVAPLDQTILLFGGAEGTIGPTWSWVVGALLAAGAVWVIWSGRGNKTAHGFPVKPAWADALLTLVLAGAILGFIAILNAYLIPQAKLERIFAARGETMPEGYAIGHGLPISVIILIVVAVVMTVVARKTRFGRYIFATGGNPDAARLSGINTRWLTVKVFALMGFLAGLSALVAQSRLQSHANDIGTLDELRVIAAAVIGGTALAGGVGTIWGAILGALIMQSLQSGMGMVGVDTPFQNIVVGAVLVGAVWLDIVYRKRLGVR